MNEERKSNIVEEEIEDNGLVDTAEDFLYPEEDWDDEYEDDEPEEREYCD